MMPQRWFRYDVERHFTGRLNLADPRRRPEMVTDAVGPAEAARGYHFLVIDSLAAITRFVAMGDVPFPRDGAESAIGWHDAPPFSKMIKPTRTARGLEENWF